MSSKELTLAPKWLNDSISRKRNVVPISVSMEDAVSKCLGRSVKPKKLKTESMIDFDENTKHWIVDIARPWPNKDAATASKADYAVEQIDLGVGTRVVDVKHLETSTKRIISCTWKDERDKAKLKQSLTQMAQYIHALQNSPLPLSQHSGPFSPKSPSN